MRDADAFAHDAKINRMRIETVGKKINRMRIETVGRSDTGGCISGKAGGGRAGREGSLMATMPVS